MAATSWMDELRSDLIEHYHYLGTTDVRDEVVWRDIGPYDILVTKESAEEEDARIAKTKGKEAKKSLEEGTSDGFKTESELELLDGGTLLVPARLAFVGLLSPSDFWFMPDGNWSRPTPFTKTFADVKLNGRAIIPTNTPAFADDFSTVLQNMEWFMKNKETPGYTKKGIFRANDLHQSINLRHILFEKTDNAAEDADQKDVKSMEKWPVPEHSEARAQFNKMKYTYRPLPLAAYDGIRGRLITADKYVTALKGAVVLVEVHLKHWAIADKTEEGNRDSYTADIEQLRVLAAPKIVSSSPEKRNPPEIAQDSPSKKRARHT